MDNENYHFIFRIKGPLNCEECGAVAGIVEGDISSFVCSHCCDPGL